MREEEAWMGDDAATENGGVTVAEGDVFREILRFLDKGLGANRKNDVVRPRKLNLRLEGRENGGGGMPAICRGYNLGRPMWKMDGENGVNRVY